MKCSTTILHLLTLIHKWLNSFTKWLEKDIYEFTSNLAISFHYLFSLSLMTIGTISKGLNYLLSSFFSTLLLGIDSYCLHFFQLDSLVGSNSDCILLLLGLTSKLYSWFSKVLSAFFFSCSSSNFLRAYFVRR